MDFRLSDLEGSPNAFERGVESKQFHTQEKEETFRFPMTEQWD